MLAPTINHRDYRFETDEAVIISARWIRVSKVRLHEDSTYEAFFQSWMMHCLNHDASTTVATGSDLCAQCRVGMDLQFQRNNAEKNMTPPAKSSSRR